MIRKYSLAFIAPLIPIFLASPALPPLKPALPTAPPAATQQRACFTAEARAEALRSAKVWQEPDPGYDPVLGYNPETGPRPGAPKVDENGVGLPFQCTANKDRRPGEGTTPKFHCSVAGVMEEDGDLLRYKVKPHFKGQQREKRNGEIYGEFLSSRFSKALGFFADDNWVADVTCPDCEKSLTSGFQGARWTPSQPAAGIELNIGKGLDVGCNDKDAAGIAEALSGLVQGGANRAEIDAFKLWLAFIDHGDTKTDNQKFACLKWTKNADNTLTCDPGHSIFYVSDMGSTWGYSSSSESKAKLDRWKGRDPIKVSGGRCTTTAKSVGDANVGEAGRQLLATGLQRLLDAEKANGLVTRVFRASRNHERDQPAEAWAAEFERKARTIIDARCSN
ncbi:MAG TPA: hypothetical protein VER08_04095 [Pyrinomonadaceae bacterium]|nr:hypothetical protein [Pyrinomonadaceae bacterium]